MIVRPYYLNILKTYRDVPLVKILAGIRRCGKSTILDMLKDDLLGSGIAADHVIHLRYTSEELDDGMTAKQMYRDIKEKMTDGERYYLLLDEVQEVDGWEKAVNSLLEGRSNVVMCVNESRISAVDINFALALDRMYKGKLKDGDLEGFTSYQIAQMKARCEFRRAKIARLYQMSYDICM